MFELFRRLVLTIDVMMLNSSRLTKICVALCAAAWLVITIIQVIRLI